VLILNRFYNVTSLVRPPGTVVPGGLMFCCVFFLSFFFFCGTLRRYISEMAGAIALKLSHMIGSV